MRGTWTALWALLASTALGQQPVGIQAFTSYPVLTDDCYTSLKSARTIIEAAYTETTDVIVVEDIAYPASFIADDYLLRSDVSCRKDD
ncbi:uncharacterized protein N7477_005748 [Penicillium maclennaniae]|uniref:uncharacterized protein n=1 Tax=Penicillium maclennaniae TaxID=1343394 RepID=UPI0025407341|nr:uncharacterized protein N7477_005748 [Penicillium maclennaniae]KAJ5670385.1 hypothetical protein N7477_005748 [Penicillium maclennaniae]